MSFDLTRTSFTLCYLLTRNYTSVNSRIMLYPSVSKFALYPDFQLSAEIKGASMQPSFYLLDIEALYVTSVHSRRMLLTLFALYFRLIVITKDCLLKVRFPIIACVVWSFHICFNYQRRRVQ